METQETPQKYVIGNETYELRTDYLGWIPERFDSWRTWVCSEWEVYDILELKKFTDNTPPRLNVTIVNTTDEKKVELIIDHGIGRNDFTPPISKNHHADNWFLFYIVATKEKPDEKFIIPMH